MTADQIREVMGPEFCAVADDLRVRFGARLVWLKAGDVEIGKDPAIGSVPSSGKDEEIERLRYWYGAKQA